MTAETEAAAAALSTDGRIDDWLVEKAKLAGESLEELHTELVLAIAIELIAQIDYVRPLRERAEELVARGADTLFEEAVHRVRTDRSTRESLHSTL